MSKKPLIEAMRKAGFVVKQTESGDYTVIFPDYRVDKKYVFENLFPDNKLHRIDSNTFNIQFKTGNYGKS